MDYNKLYVIYFSPTQSTKKVSLFVGKGLNMKIPTEMIDNTNVSVREKKHKFSSDDIVIVGCPTYGGRLPTVEPMVFDNLYGENTLAIIFVTFGNSFDDTLLELKNFLTERGFICISAGAIATQHSGLIGIGVGRPNKEDLEMAVKIGENAKKKIEENNLSEIIVKGNFPYKEKFPNQMLSPITTDKCVRCYLCFRWCPTDAIDKKDPNITDVSKCIKCQGCVKRCPVDARIIINDEYNEKIKMFSDMLKDKSYISEVFI